MSTGRLFVRASLESAGSRRTASHEPGQGLPYSAVDRPLDGALCEMLHDPVHASFSVEPSHLPVDRPELQDSSQDVLGGGRGSLIGPAVAVETDHEVIAGDGPILCEDSAGPRVIIDAD